MNCQPYITIQEFKDSPFFCHLPACCSPSGIVDDTEIESYILTAQAMINSYMGWEICVLPRKDIFQGDNSNTKFLQYMPMPITGSLQIIENNPMNELATIYNIPDVKKIDLGISKIFLKSKFKSYMNYIVDYQAGYETIPSDIKTAMFMLVLNVAQRLDNNNMNNPDLSIDSINVNKVAVANFGSSKMVKNITMNSMKELSDMPVPVARILDRYRYIGGM